jgi:hypothetical protein
MLLQRPVAAAIQGSVNDAEENLAGSALFRDAGNTKWL